MKRTLFLILAILTLTACGKTEPAPSATGTPIPPTATVAPTATAMLVPSPTPTPLPYYLEDGSLYDLDEITGEYTLVGKGLAAITTAADGIVVVDGNGEEIFRFENGVWVEVERVTEFIPVAVTEEERVALQEFLDNYEMDWDWDSIPRIMKVNADGEELGPVEYGFRTLDWDGVADETWPTYTEDFEFISLAMVGVKNAAGRDRLVVMIPSESREQVGVMFADTMKSTAGIQAYLFESGEVRVDASPLWFTEGLIPNAKDVDFVRGVKNYFAYGGSPFQSFVIMTYNWAETREGIEAHWEDIQGILENDSGLTGLLYDHGVHYSANFVPGRIVFPDELSESLGY